MSDAHNSVPFYRRIRFWLVTIGAVAAVIAVVAIGSAADEAATNPHTVIYKVDGTVATADINYHPADGSGHHGTEHAADEPVPWSKVVKIDGALSQYTLTATAPAAGSDKGTVTCSVLVDGTAVSHDTARGSSPTVHCSAAGSGT